MQHHILFIHLFVDGYSDCSHILTIVNNVINMGIPMSLKVLAFDSLGCMPRSGMAGMCGESTCNFF